MSCTGYRPIFGTGQLDGTRYAGSNCTCWSGARAVDFDTCGARRPSSSEVRFWTQDTVGGTNLAQVDYALRTHTPTDLDVRYRYPWSEFTRRVRKGESAILQGWYTPIRESRFRGSETFGGNHAILVTPGLVALDPLADGRRTGIYKYHGEAYPESLLRSFAGKLNLATDGTFRPLGDGLCYAAFTRDNWVTYRAHCPADTDYTRYLVTDGRITGHRRMHTNAGWSAVCTPPRNIVTQSGAARVSLVQLTKAGSPMDGWWVSSRWSVTVP